MHTTLEKAKIAIPARDKTPRELNLSTRCERNKEVLFSAEGLEIQTKGHEKTDNRPVYIVFRNPIFSF